MTAPDADALTARGYRFGGRPVRMRVPDPELRRILHAPFSHLACEAGQEPHLTIEVGTREVPPAGKGAREWAFPAFTFASSADGRQAWCTTAGGRWWLDREAGEIRGAADAALLPLHERAKPMPFLLPLWYADRGITVVHAALIARGGEGILIAGPSGSGKSTTTLLSRQSFAILGDDHVGLERTDAGFSAWSLYATTRLDPTHASSLGIPAPVIEAGEKALIHLDSLGATTAPSARLAAIVVPHVDPGAATRLQRASPAAALRALAPSSIFLPIGSGRSGFEFFASIAAEVPAWSLTLGRDPASSEQLLSDLVGGAVGS